MLIDKDKSYDVMDAFFFFTVLILAHFDSQGSVNVLTFNNLKTIQYVFFSLDVMI